MSIKINGKSLVKGQINGKEIQKIVINGNTVYTSVEPIQFTITNQYYKLNASTSSTYTTTVNKIYSKESVFMGFNRTTTSYSSYPNANALPGYASLSDNTKYSYFTFGKTSGYNEDSSKTYTLAPSGNTFSYTQTGSTGGSTALNNIIIQVNRELDYSQNGYQLIESFNNNTTNDISKTFTSKGYYLLIVRKTRFRYSSSVVPTLFKVDGNDCTQLKGYVVDNYDSSYTTPDDCFALYILKCASDNETHIIKYNSTYSGSMTRTMYIWKLNIPL